MTEVPRRQIIGGIFIAIGAFAFGILALIGVTIGPLTASALFDADADAAYHTVSITIAPCDCLTKFTSAAPLEGSGTSDNPYISKSNTVNVVVGVSGSGLVTIEDADGNILFSYNKTDDDYADIPVTIRLGDEVGTYFLEAKLDGNPLLSGTDIPAIMYIKYDSADSGIDVPNTGYIYLGNYALGATRSLAAGFLSVIVFGALWLILILATRRREADNARSARSAKNRMNQEIGSRSIKKAGLIKTKAKTKKSPKKTK